MRKRVAILHPWFPQYRESFFEGLVEYLAELDIDVDVYHGPPPPEWGERGDSIETDYSHALPTKFLRLGRRNVAFKDVTAIRRAAPYDLLILEQAVRNLETYQLMLRPVSKRLAFWGHGKTYTTKVSFVQEYLKSRLTNRAQWFFGYTEAGVRTVVESGFPAAQTSVVVNSIDTTSLVGGIDSITVEERRQLQRELDLHGRTAIFLGGLDESKRLPFLLDAAARIAEKDGDFRLIIVGNGSQRALVEVAARSNRAIKYVGTKFGREKHALLSVAQVIAMPGRVGLVAVDSLAAGLPVVTTAWQWHAPEFEYLENQVTCSVVADNVSAYAHELGSLIADTARLEGMSEAAKTAAPNYSIEAMIRNFAAGVLGCLEVA